MPNPHTMDGSQDGRLPYFSDNLIVATFDEAQNTFDGSVAVLNLFISVILGMIWLLVRGIFMLIIYVFNIVLGKFGQNIPQIDEWSPTVFFNPQFWIALLCLVVFLFAAFAPFRTPIDQSLLRLQNNVEAQQSLERSRRIRTHPLSNLRYWLIRSSRGLIWLVDSPYTALVRFSRSGYVSDFLAGTFILAIIIYYHLGDAVSIFAAPDSIEWKSSGWSLLVLASYYAGSIPSILLASYFSWLVYRFAFPIAITAYLFIFMIFAIWISWTRHFVDRTSPAWENASSETSRSVIDSKLSMFRTIAGAALSMVFYYYILGSMNQAYMEYRRLHFGTLGSLFQNIVGILYYTLEVPLRVFWSLTMLLRRLSSSGKSAGSGGFRAVFPDPRAPGATPVPATPVIPASPSRLAKLPHPKNSTTPAAPAHPRKPVISTSPFDLAKPPRTRTPTPTTPALPKTPVMPASPFGTLGPLQASPSLSGHFYSPRSSPEAKVGSDNVFKPSPRALIGGYSAIVNTVVSFFKPCISFVFESLKILVIFIARYYGYFIVLLILAGIVGAALFGTDFVLIFLCDVGASTSSRCLWMVDLISSPVMMYIRKLEAIQWGKTIITIVWFFITSILYGATEKIVAFFAGEGATQTSRFSGFDEPLPHGAASSFFYANRRPMWTKILWTPVITSSILLFFWFTGLSLDWDIIWGHKYLTAFVFFMGIKTIISMLHRIKFNKFNTQLAATATPTHTPADVTVVIPTGAGWDISDAETMKGLSSILAENPAEVILTTNGSLDYHMRLNMICGHFGTHRMRVTSVHEGLLRGQFIKATSQARTKIICYAHTRVAWPEGFLKEALAPFEEETVGLIGVPAFWTRSLLNSRALRPPAEGRNVTERFLDYLFSVSLFHTNYKNATNLLAGNRTVSARTALIRTEIVQSPEFRFQFVHETYNEKPPRPAGIRDNADQFISRFVTRAGYKTVFCNGEPGGDSRAFVLTLSPARHSFYKYCERLVIQYRGNFRAELTSVFSYIPILVRALFEWSLLNDFIGGVLLWKAYENKPFLGVFLAVLIIRKFFSAGRYGHWTAHPGGLIGDLVFMVGGVAFGQFCSLLRLWALVTTWVYTVEVN